MIDSLHMYYLQVTYNPCILQPHWSTVRMHDGLRFKVGNTIIIQYGKRLTEIGEASIISVATLPLSKISPIISASVTGKANPNYMRAILAKMYPGITEDTLLDWVVLRWEQRYLAEQEDMVRCWWESQVAQTPHYADFKKRIA